MYSRIARAKFRTDKSDDVIRVAKEGVAANALCNLLVASREAVAHPTV